MVIDFLFIFRVVSKQKWYFGRLMLLWLLLLILYKLVGLNRRSWLDVLTG